MESLGSYVVLSLNASSKRLGDDRARCAAARGVVGALAKAKASFVFHPYPVTPYHEDYLHHFDLIAAAKAAYEQRAPNDLSNAGLKLRAQGGLAEALLPAAARPSDGEGDGALEEIEVGALTAPGSAGLGGWLGPPWSKTGWFQAQRLLGEGLVDDRAKRAVASIHRRLVTGAYADAGDRIELERTLVSLLTRGCERVVVGYTVRREYYGSEYSSGIENVAADSQAGLRSAIFVRTAKLKDFPWNGWLRIGTATPPAAAWNPVGGFTDRTGGFMWAGLGDPAMLPAPRGAGWITNRVTSVRMTGGSNGALAVPPEAVKPEDGTGALARVGPGKEAAVKILYRVAMSAFHDGSPMTVADILYPFVFAYRWGTKAGGDDAHYDPVVDQATGLLREWLVGLRILKVDTETKSYGEDLKFTYEVPVVETYLARGTSDAMVTAAVAPPWSTVPWPVLVLMEEAVRRGAAAFSEAEAKRRGVAWLDLARDATLGRELAALVETFSRTRYVPEALRGFVTPEAAGRRWESLKRFYERHGHFLVTNGPYRLATWSDDAVTLTVFRDLTYPLGVGAFDQYAIPLRAFITKVENHGGRFELRAEVEVVSKFQRTYEIVREAVRSKPSAGDDRHFPECRWVVVGADGRVARAGTSRYTEAGALAIDLRGVLKPGRYTILAALYLGGNAVNPEVRAVEYRVPGS